MSTDNSPQPASEAVSVTAQGAVVSGMTLLSRISGFARDLLLSHFLGASGAADAFLVAFRIPNFFRRLFAEGAFSQAFVPVLARYRALGLDELKGFVAVIGGNLGLALALVVILGVLFAEGLTLVFAPGFWRNPAQLQLTTELLRVTFPYLGFISLTAFAAAILNAHGRYAAAAFTPVLLNLCLMAAMLLAARTGAGMAPALAWGVLAAGVVQLGFLAPNVARLGVAAAPRPSTRHEGAREVGRLLVPALLASSAGQLNALIDTILASMLLTGSIAWLYYADRLLELPIGLVAVALGTVLLPSLSRLAGAGDRAAFSRTLDWGLRMGVLLGLPASMALALLAEPLIATIFLHGEMTAIDAAMASLALRAFACGALPLVLVKILAPAFFADKDTRTPLRFALTAIGVNVALNLSLFWWFGHVGLALATAASGWVHFWLLWRGVHGAGYYQATSALGRTAVRALGASALMGAVLAALSPSAEFWFAASALHRVPWLVGLVAAGGLTYAAALWVSGLRVAQLQHRI